MSGRWRNLAARRIRRDLAAVGTWMLGAAVLAVTLLLAWTVLGSPA